MSTSIIANHEGPSYITLQKMGEYEVRKYDSWVIAETVVEGTHGQVGQQGFHRLAGYIFGNNDQNIKIDMTAPVTQY